MVVVSSDQLKKIVGGMHWCHYAMVREEVTVLFHLRVGERLREVGWGVVVGKQVVKLCRWWNGDIREEMDFFL